MDAEVLGHEPVRSAAPRQHPHEGQVCHILHGGEDESGSGFGRKSSISGIRESGIGLTMAFRG